MGIKKPICWVDEQTNVITFRHDVPPDQARQLEPIIRQAFNAGLKSGYRQGLNKANQAEPQPDDPAPCFICGRPATRTATSFEGTPTTVELCDDCNPHSRPLK